MNTQNLVISSLMACLLAFGFCGLTTQSANAAPVKKFSKLNKAKVNSETDTKRRGRASRVVLPIAPSYQAYDYPYYYSRGFYPRHIGPGYVYYGIPYNYPRASSPEDSGRCYNGRKKCTVN